jgi:diketogulonate reductase-like aldo/keto reductase
VAVLILKPIKPVRIADNLDGFDFDLTTIELASIDALATGQRATPIPRRSPWRASAARRWANRA